MSGSHDTTISRTTNTGAISSVFAPVDGFALAWAGRLGEWLADVDLRLLEGAGHFTPVEAPDAFAAAIRERLA